MSIKIFGSSDDTIVINGDINDEISPSAEEILLACSDGTLLSVEYDGNWRIHRVKTGMATYSHVPVEDEEDEDNTRREDNTPKYSDVVTLIMFCPFQWVAAAETVVRR